MSLEQLAARIAQAAPKQDKLEYESWLGSMRSVPHEQVPHEYLGPGLTGTNEPASNFIFLPRYGTWIRRLGQSIKFDTLSGNTEVAGLLPATWENDPASGSLGAKARWGEEFLSDSITDHVPTTAWLATRETILATKVDDGRFGTLYLRDQVNSVNYQLLSEFGTGTYPVPGSLQYYRVAALRYDSGDGGLTRGAGTTAALAERAARFVLSGSRRFLKVGGWWYFPNLLGTPCRWNGAFIGSASLGAASVYSRPTSDSGAGTWRDQAAGSTNIWQAIDETPFSDTDFVTQPATGGGSSYTFAATVPTLPTSPTITIRMQVRRTNAVTTAGFFASISRGGTSIITTGAAFFGSDTFTGGGTFESHSRVLTASETAAFVAASGSITCVLTPGGNTNTDIYAVSFWEVEYASSVLTETNANRLIPSGPIPPLHSGTIAGTSPVVPIYARPDGDHSSGVGSWVNQTGSGSNLYQSIDESVANDTTDYIRITGANSACSFDIQTPSSPPTNADAVTVRFRTAGVVFSSPVVLTTEIRQGTTTYATYTTTFYSSSGGYINGGLTVPAAAIDLINTADADWSDVYIRFTSSNCAGLDSITITQAYLEILPAAIGGIGGWKGKDRFYKAVAYRFEDDSVWAPSDPRAPNDILTSGFDLVTVDSANPDLPYSYVTWSNLPIPPPGVKSLLLLRTTKIDSTVDDSLKINRRDLRLVEEVAAGTTTYQDFEGDDESLILDASRDLFARLDHAMPPRARYIGGGPMRVAHAYGGISPCAIEIAPIGRLADYDLNTNDATAATYGSGTSDASYMRMTLDTSGVGVLELANDTGSVANLVSLSMTTYNTVQKLVDRINATSVAADGQQWRAQICPGADPAANPATYLLPHYREIASCVISGQTITVASNALGKVAVNSFIIRAGTNTGAYVTSIDTVTTSTSQITFVGTVTAGTVTCQFVFDLGDNPTSLSGKGYQRVIANSKPEFLYWNNTYLNQFPIEKDSAWLTIAAPGSNKSAANSFSGKYGKFRGSSFNAGMCMGIQPVDEGFVVPYSNKVGAIANKSTDRAAGADEFFQLYIIDESRGCVAWNTVVPGNRFVPFMSAEGMCAADLTTVKLLSRMIYAHPRSDAATGVGDFSYELPLCVAATAADNDSAYASARIMRSMLRVSYRASGSHPNRMVILDFSSSDQSTGLNALFRKPDVPWGWSLPLAYAKGITAMCEGRRSDGLHLYGWNEENLGTFDGRIEELDTGETDDNSTAIVATAPMPWIRAEHGEELSFQECEYEALCPTSSTGSIVFHRSYSDDTYTLTPSTATSPTLVSELKMLPTLGARVQTGEGYFDFRQATGSARELRYFVTRFKRLKNY